MHTAKDEKSNVHRVRRHTDRTIIRLVVLVHAFKQLVYPSDNNGPRELYEILLPYLNNRPFSANAYVNPRFLTKNDVVGNGNQPVQYNSNLPQGVDDTLMNVGHGRYLWRAAWAWAKCHA